MWRLSWRSVGAMQRARCRVLDYLSFRFLDQRNSRGEVAPLPGKKFKLPAERGRSLLARFGLAHFGLPQVFF